MPKRRRHNLPPALFQHLLDRIQARKISASQLELLARWLDTEPEVPEGALYKSFSGMTVCGDGELIKTFQPGCAAGRVVTQIPFANQAGMIAGLLQQLRDGDFVGRQRDVRTGALPQMLNSVAEFFEEDVSTALTAALALIEPAILIVMGIVVVFILISLYLPIFSMGQAA